MNGVYDDVCFFFYALNFFSFFLIKKKKPNLSQLPFYVRHYLSLSESHTMLSRYSSSLMLHRLYTRPLIHP